METSPPNPSDPTTLEKITTLLKTKKDDTSRFVGLALLKSVLDNSSGLRSDPAIITQLWRSISPKFLDRLLRSGGGKGDDNAKNMLSLAVSVLHTFAVLLPEEEKGDERAVDRIEGLVEALVPSTGETTPLILQTLLTLVSLPPGALKFDNLADLSPLTEIAPSHPMTLDILFYAWLTVMPSKLSSPSPSTTSDFALKISTTIRSLTSSFSNTDAVTLLTFLAHFLRHIPPLILSHLTPPDPCPPPVWVMSSISHIHALCLARPTPAARSAYTILSASLVQANYSYAKILFGPTAIPSDEQKPSSYLLLTLLLIDIRSTLPSLLTKLNSPSYPVDALRVSSALELIPAWVSTVLGNVDEDEENSLATLPIPPDLLLKLRTQITETLSLALEYIRDRWDFSVSGVQGLDPAYRSKEAELPSGEKRLTLTWDSSYSAVGDGGGGAGGRPDIVVASALKALAAWTSEDDESPLRRELSGIVDVLAELYGASSCCCCCCCCCSSDSSCTVASLSPASPAQHRVVEMGGTTETKPEEEEGGNSEGREGGNATAAQSAARELRSRSQPLDPRPVILACLQVLTYTSSLEPDAGGISLLNEHNIFFIISNDMLNILTRCAEYLSSSSSSSSSENRRPPEPHDTLASSLEYAPQPLSFLRTLLQMHADAGFQVPEVWLDFATKFAGWGGAGTAIADCPRKEMGAMVVPLLLETVADSLHLCADLLEKLPPGVRKRYVHTATALSGIGRWVVRQCQGATDNGKTRGEAEDAVQRLQGAGS
ncbi:hypothetical protein MKZ38_003809 [Zalerion maritima]|uniref:Neurochondrin-domain-containing protein n=1 Tax=Zalerion maritima TaxID=339359 RepID=A0AAD5WS50_9PEZI|nr:hypothetical protein MKZ38_003809 [Zalerion maritima]